MDIQTLCDLALECGFSAAVPLDPGTLKFLPEVRAMCAADKCRSYGRSWSCPPAAGEIEEIAEKCRDYTSGILVQTIGQREDEYDFEALMDTDAAHNESFMRLTERFNAMALDMLPMGAGACRRCETCTFPDSPCRFPELVFPSMEACGLFVSQVCKDNDIPYYYGKNSMAFVSCYLFR